MCSSAHAGPSPHSAGPLVPGARRRPGGTARRRHRRSAWFAGPPRPARRAPLRPAAPAWRPSAFQIVHRLRAAGKTRRVLCLADCNILIDQTKDGDFKPLQKVTTKVEHRRLDLAYEVYFALYQQLVARTARRYSARSSADSSTSSSWMSATAEARRRTSRGARFSSTSTQLFKSA